MLSERQRRSYLRKLENGDEEGALKILGTIVDEDSQDEDSQDEGSQDDLEFSDSEE
jgi:hypothetical protein